MRKLLAILLMLAVCVGAIWGAAHASTPGDANGDGAVTISDVVDLVRYIFDGVELPRTEWVEVDTTVSVVWILDRPFTVADYPIRVQKHYYVAGADTTWLREVVIDEATYLHNGKPFVRTAESSEKGK